MEHGSSRYDNPYPLHVLLLERIRRRRARSDSNAETLPTTQAQQHRRAAVYQVKLACLLDTASSVHRTWVQFTVQHQT